MKRIAMLISGTALAAALSFGAQATNPPASTDSTNKPAATTKKHVKKHKTSKKNAAAATTPAPDATKK